MFLPLLCCRRSVPGVSVPSASPVVQRVHAGVQPAAHDGTTQHVPLSSLLPSCYPPRRFRRPGRFTELPAADVSIATVEYLASWHTHNVPMPAGRSIASTNVPLGCSSDRYVRFGRGGIGFGTDTETATSSCDGRV